MDNVARIAALEAELSKQTALAQNGQSAIDTNRRLAKVIVDLQSRHKEAMELVGFAIKQLEEDRHCTMCMNHFVLRGKCYGVSVCGQGRPAWRWQHADRYKALKEKESGVATPHADPIEAGTRIGEQTDADKRTEA